MTKLKKGTVISLIVTLVLAAAIAANSLLFSSLLAKNNLSDNSITAESIPDVESLLPEESLPEEKIYKYDHYQFPTIEEIRAIKEDPKASITSDDYRLPEEYLKNLSAKGLITACLEHPQTHYFLLYSYPMSAYNYLKTLDVVTELFSREDMNETVYNFYLDFSANDYKENDTFLILGSSLFEFIVADCDYLEKLTREQRFDIMKKAWQLHLESGMAFPLGESGLIMVRILNMDYPEFKELKMYEQFEHFDKYGWISVFEDDERQEFLDFAESVLENYKYR